MYDFLDHGTMLAQSERIQAYGCALERSVGAGSVVLDIGTGAGIFALMACRLGARRVYAIEASDVIHVARQIAADNGFGERIEFIQDLSTSVTLPERADVVVSELGTVVQNPLPTLVDARKRLLATDGRLIPEADALWAAAADAPAEYRRVSTWETDSLDFDMSAARELACNNWWLEDPAETAHLLTEPQPWATIEYTTVDDLNLRGEFEAGVSEAGTIHAILIWSQRRLCRGCPEPVYRRSVFPLRAPIDVVPGDSIRCRIEALLLGREYTWRWRTRISDTAGRRKAEFDQSTIRGVPMGTEMLRSRLSRSSGLS